MSGRGHHGVLLAGQLSAVPMLWNPSDKSSYLTLSLGNTKSEMNISPGITATGRATPVMPATVKSYVEILCNALPSAYGHVGIISSALSLSYYIGQHANSWGFRSDGYKINSANPVSVGVTWGAGAVIGIAHDPVAGKIWFAKNNLWVGSGSPSTGANPAYTSAALQAANLLLGISGYAKFDAFTIRAAALDQSYAPPSGFSAPG